VGAAPVALSQVSYDMSLANILLSSGTYQQTGTSAHSWLQAQDDAGYIDAPELWGDGNVSAVVPGTASTASASVASGAVVDNSIATTPYGDAYVSAGTTSDLGLYVENAEVITITLDVSSEVSVSTDALNETSFGFADDLFALYAYNDDGNLNTNPLVNAYITYDLTVANGDIAGPLSMSDKLTLTYDLGALKGTPFTGFLLLQNTSQTMVDAQNWNVPSDVPEPGSLSLMVMGLAVLVPLVLRRKN
jgi:hypothetical protein